jgi:glycosyltransferase involved in cell wall biosynthesis
VYFSMNKTTLVSVVLPVYNGRCTLSESIESLISQVGITTEIIVLDDGSTDDSLDIISSFTDSRLRVIRHKNMGLAKTLNKGVALARGHFIARQDQDDLILPNRLAKQTSFLNINPKVAIVGTWAQIYSEDMPTSRYHRHPSSNDALQLELLFDNPFVHSSMMIRADVLRDVGGYSEDIARQPPEDYELWSRIARKYSVANLPEVLTVYREVDGSMSRKGDNPFLKNVIRISSENLQHRLYPIYSINECSALSELYHLGGKQGFKSTLTRRRACEMLAAAAGAISGPRDGWTSEFLSSFERMQLLLESRFLRSRIPWPLLDLARLIKNRFKKNPCT